LSQSIKLIALLTIFLTADSISSLLANEDLAANLASSQVKLSGDETNCCRKICHYRISYRMAKRRNTVCTDAVACERNVQKINEVAVQDDLDSLTQDISYESDVVDQQPESKINPADGDEALRNDAQTPGDDIDETDTDQTTEVLETPSEAADDGVDEDATVRVNEDDAVRVDEDDVAEQIIDYEQETDLDASTIEGVEQSDENEKNDSEDYDSEEYYSSEQDTEEDYLSEEADTEQYDTDEYDTDEEVDTEEYESEQYGNGDSETQPEGTEGDLENQDFVDPVAGDEGTSDESTPEETRDAQAEIQDEIDQNAPQQEPVPADEYPIDQVPYAVDEEDNPFEDSAYDSDQADDVEAQPEESRSLPELSIDLNLVKLIANWQSLSPETQREILELVRKDVQRVASGQAGPSVPK